MAAIGHELRHAIEVLGIEATWRFLMTCWPPKGLVAHYLVQGAQFRTTVAGVSLTADTLTRNRCPSAVGV